MILLIGDIHGNFDLIKRKAYGLENSTIIQVGDFGIGFSERQHDENRLENLNQFLSERGIKLLVIRGNHDNPIFFEGNHIYSNLSLLPDYSTQKIEGTGFLFIGGAVSIDRKVRISNDNNNIKWGSSKRSYWENEGVVYEPKKLRELSDISVIVSHTAPDWCFPDNKLGYGSLVDHFACSDSELKSDIFLERTIMRNIFLDVLEKNKITHHFYGHFHQSKKEYHGHTLHHLLDVNELVEFNPLNQQIEEGSI